MTFNAIRKSLQGLIDYYSKDIYEDGTIFLMEYALSYPKTSYRYVLDVKITDIMKHFLIKHKKYSSKKTKLLDLIDDLATEDYATIFNNIYVKNFEDNRDFMSFVLEEKYGNVEESTVDEILDIFEELTDCKDFCIYIKDVIEERGKFELDSDNYVCLDMNRVKPVSSTSRRTRKRLMNHMRMSLDDKEYCSDEGIKITNDVLQLLMNACIKEFEGLSPKKVRSMAERYRNALEVLENNLDKEDMSVCLDAVSKISDEFIKKQIYLFIHEHNKPYYDRLEKEYSEKSDNMESRFIEYFNKFDLSFGTLNPNFKTKIMEDGLDIVKKKVNIISCFVEKKDYFSVIAGTDLNNLLFIESCIKKQYIDSYFIKSNLSIILLQDVFDVFKTNYQLLVDKVNIKRYGDKSFLLASPEIIRTNILLLEKYGILYNNCYDLSFIKEPIKEKLSLFIEVGLENEILNNPDILNADIDLAKRILLTKEIGEDIYVDDKIDELVINKSKFFVSPSKVSLKLNRDNSKYNGNGVIYLSNIDATQLSYIVDGEVIVPKMRVKEQPVSIKDLVKDSLYDEQQIRILEKNSIK